MLSWQGRTADKVLVIPACAWALATVLIADDEPSMRFGSLPHHQTGRDASPPAVHYRVCRDRLDSYGKVTIRYLGRLRHLYVSYKRRGQAVTLLVAGFHLKVVAEDGSVLRDLILDSNRRYQPVPKLGDSTMS